MFFSRLCFFLMYFPISLFSNSSTIWYPFDRDASNLFDSAFKDIQGDDFVIYLKTNNRCDGCVFFTSNIPSSIVEKLIYYNPEYGKFRSSNDSILSSNKYINKIMKLIHNDSPDDCLMKINKDLRLVKIVPFSKDRNYQTIQNLINGQVSISKNRSTTAAKLTFMCNTNRNGQLLALAEDGNLFVKMGDSFSIRNDLVKVPNYLGLIDLLPVDLSRNLIKDKKIVNQFFQDPVKLIRIFDQGHIQCNIFEMNCIEKTGETLTGLGFYFLEITENESSTILLLRNSNQANKFSIAPFLFAEYNESIGFTTGNFFTGEDVKGRMPLFTEYKIKNKKVAKIRLKHNVPLELINDISKRTFKMFNVFKSIDGCIFFEYGGVVLNRNNKIIVPEIVKAIMNNSQYKLCKMKYLEKINNQYKMVYSIGYTLIEVLCDSDFNLIDLKANNIKPYFDPSHIVDGNIIMGNEKELVLGVYRIEN